MNAWDRVLATLASEFSDLPDVEMFTRVVVRLLLAALLGALIGLERELAGKPAGLRTHMLVSLGAALFVLIPLQAGIGLEALTRVIQGLLAGVGFLCAGAILKGSTEDEVHGLTTAASLWMTSAIGMGAGLGRDTTAALSTLLVLGILRLEGRCAAGSTSAGAGAGSPAQPTSTKGAEARQSASVVRAFGIDGQPGRR